MKTASLHEVDNQYLALSYTWGNANDRKPITINSRPVLVTINLEAFLQEWRHSAFREHNNQEYDVFLWIDAICINQEDLRERESQVMLMSKIYPSAKGTLSWLGRGSNSCEYGLESIRTFREHIKKLLEEDNNADFLKKDAWPIGFYLQDANAKGGFKNFAWDGIHDLFSVEYWIRARIQQEFALAKHVTLMYGGMAANLQNVRYTLQWLNRIEDQNCPAFFSRLLWRRLSQNPYRNMLAMHSPLRRLGSLQLISKDHTIIESSPMVFKVLYNFLIDVRSTDPRDLLYSLLGMMDLGIRADYERSIEETYYQFAKGWITKPCGLIFLLGAGGLCPISSHHVKPTNCALPSWVPCWMSLKGGLARIGVDMSKESNSGVDIQQATIQVTGRRLRVRGRIVSRVKWDKSINAGNLESFLFTYLHDQAVTKTNTASRRLQLLLRLICTDKHPITRKPIEFTSSSWIEVLEVLNSVALAFRTRFSLPLPDIVRWMGIQTNGDVAGRLLNEPTPPGVDPSEPAVKEEGGHSWFAFASHLGVNLVEHTVFTTANGQIGWSLRELREGDIVCILFGLKTPVILREVDDSFRYISPCSLPGLMDDDLLTSDFDSTNIQTLDIY